MVFIVAHTKRGRQKKEIPNLPQKFDINFKYVLKNFEGMSFDGKSLDLGKKEEERSV